MRLFELIRFIWKHHREFPKIKKEAWDIKVRTAEALGDGKITKDEAIDILREIDGFLDILIDILEK